MVGYRIVRPDTAFAAAPAAGRRRPREMHTKHLAFIRSLPCCVCGAHKQVESAHVRMASAIHGKRASGMGEKPDDTWVVPLCAHHHRTAPDAQHAVGEVAFWSAHGIDPLALALALWCATGDEQRAESIISETRARAAANPQGDRP